MTFKRIAIPAGLGCSAMSPRTRVVAIVAVVAAVAAGGTVGVTLLQTRGETSGTTARKGFPPLDIPASPALRLYRAGKHAQAEALFSRSHDLPDEIGAAFARWPHGTLDDVKKLVAANPQSGLAELHLGLAYYWSVRLHLGVLLLWTRQVAKGEAQLRLAISAEPGSVYARQAKALLDALAGGGSK